MVVVVDPAWTLVFDDDDGTEFDESSVPDDDDSTEGGAWTTVSTAMCAATCLGPTCPPLVASLALGGGMGPQASGQTGWESLGAGWVLPCGPMSSTFKR